MVQIRAEAKSVRQALIALSSLQLFSCTSLVKDVAESTDGGARTYGTTSGGTGGISGALRILPLGDGITASTCYRAKLWQQLTDAGDSHFDFVGTMNNGDPCNVSASYDKDNEGHAGYRATYVLQSGNTDLATWFNGRPADIVLMQLGANDIVLDNAAQQDILSAYDKFLAALRAQNPQVKLFIALITRMSASSCVSVCAASVESLNAAIPIWATSVNTAASPVSVVDLNTGFDVTNTTDGIIPNETGSAWIANRWYSAISSLVN